MFVYGNPSKKSPYNLKVLTSLQFSQLVMLKNLMYKKKIKKVTNSVISLNLF
jgi:hypothetical protein